MTEEHQGDFEVARDVGIASVAAMLGEPVQVDGASLAILPEGYEVRDLEHLQNKPNRIRAAPVFRDVASLVRYVNVFDVHTALAFSDPAKLRLTVALEYHRSNAPSHDNHRPSFQAELHHHFEPWAKLDGKLQSQADWTRFLEVHARRIVRPDPADVMDLVMNFDMRRTMTFVSNVRLTSGTRELVFKEEDESKHPVKVPEIIAIKVPVFEGGPAETIELRFRYRITDGKLAIAVEFDDLTEVKRNAFDKLVEQFQVEESRIELLTAVL